MNKNIILSISVLLVIIFLMITIYNVYLNKKEHFNNNNNSTTLENDLKNTLDNLQSEIRDYSNRNIDIVNEKILEYTDKLNTVTKEWNENNNIDSECVFDESIELNNYKVIRDKVCKFELDCSNGESDSYPKIYQNMKTIQDCARQCTQEDECVAFSYKDNERDQQCILSSVCTENNAEKDLNYNLYLKKDLDLTNFPLLNYKIDYNKQCRNDIYESIDNNPISTNITKNDCSRQCNDDINCISFEFTPNDGNANIGDCKKYSKCYEYGCLEDSGNNDTKCTNTSLYTKKTLIPDGVVIPEYINCNTCDNDSTVYNRDFLRLYEYDDGNNPIYIFTHNVSKIQNELEDDIFKNINYYKITNDIKVKLYDSYNFKGEHMWLEPTFNRMKISDLPEKYRSFKSFEIFKKSDVSDIVKNCKGFWKPCRYNNRQELISEWKTTQKASENGDCLEEKIRFKKCNQDCEHLHDNGIKLYDISMCVANEDEDTNEDLRSFKKLKKIVTKRTENNGTTCDDRIFEKEFECENKDIENNPYKDSIINWEEISPNTNLRTKTSSGKSLNLYWDIQGNFKSSIQNIRGQNIEYDISFTNRLRNNKIVNIRPILRKIIVGENDSVTTKVGVYTNHWYFEEDNMYIKFCNVFDRKDNEFYVIYKNAADLKEPIDNITTIKIYDVNNKIEVVLTKY